MVDSSYQGECSLQHFDYKIVIAQSYYSGASLVEFVPTEEIENLP